MSTLNTDREPQIARLIAQIDTAGRLVESAAASVRSFYDDDRKRFVRDTLDELKYDFSTGGAAVVADLWDLEPHVPYLKRVLNADEHFKALDNQRKGASAEFARSDKTLILESALGDVNAYSTAVAAGQVIPYDPQAPRARALGAMSIHHYGDGWPTLKNVEHGHPYVARRVQRSAELALAKCASSGNASRIVADAKLGEGVPEVAKRALQARKNLQPDKARRKYREAAAGYLWQQYGHANPRAGSAPSVLAYDPVGACFALEILLHDVGIGDGDASQRLAEFEDLIRLTVHHVLDGLTPEGSLAYGVPFSYSEKGMGSFATSISGLAALARVLNNVFAVSRADSYPNAAFLERLVDGNDELFDRLFSITSAIAGARRKAVTSKGRAATGWSTDRAPSRTRIESWVTVDVLTFAVGLRLLIQEVAHMRVARKYGARRIRDEMVWPCEPDSAEYQRGKGFLLDPDDPGGGKGDEKAPLHQLHRAFEPFMRRDTTEWESSMSAVLLFGPPGTAKSTLVKSLAQKLEWQFLELTPSNFVDRGLEMIEQRSREIFQELGVLRETVVLFDELDSLLTDREMLPPGNILTFTVPALLPKLQQLTKTAKRQRLALFFATNFFDRLDAAVVRRGRMDARFVVLPYNSVARQAYLGQRLANPPSDATEKTALAVFEDLERYANEVQGQEGPDVPVIGIAPTLYFSRCPRPKHRQQRSRSTARLAIEVAEVVGRLLDDTRVLGADANVEEIQKRLEALASDERMAAQRTWLELCNDLIAALDTSAH
jgi:hypothetical protein